MLRLADAASAKLRVGGGELVRSHRAMGLARSAVRAAGWLLFLLVTSEWLGFVLGRFPYTRAWSEQFHDFLLGTAANLLVGVAHATPGLLIAIVIVVLARSVDIVQRRFFRGVQQGRFHVGWVDKDTAPPTRRLATLAIWAFAAVMAYPYIPGSSTDAFKGLTVLLGLMVSVGASGIVGQAVSGLILMYTRTLRPGDFVRVGEAEGTVTVMGLFTTRVDTGMGEELTLPNATILGSATRNFSRPAQREGIALTANVTIGYDVPWRQVAAMLAAAAQRTPGVAACALRLRRAGCFAPRGSRSPRLAPRGHRDPCEQQQRRQHRDAGAVRVNLVADRDEQHRAERGERHAPGPVEHEAAGRQQLQHADPARGIAGAERAPIVFGERRRRIEVSRARMREHDGERDSRDRRPARGHARREHRPQAPAVQAQHWIVVRQ